MNSLLEPRKTSDKNYPRLLSCFVASMFSPEHWQVQSALHICCGFHTHGFTNLRSKILVKKHSRKFQEAKLEFAAHGKLFT